DHLCSLARPGPGFTVPNAVPPAEDIEPVSYGWCHGVVGTVRLFWVLGDLATVDAGLLAARRSGLPRRLRPGFWDNLGRCCGSAGVGEAVLDRYQQTGDPELLAFADELARDILDRAERDDDGTRWRFTEHADGEERLMRPEAGWMQGAAGIAAYLLRLHRVHRDGPAATRLAWPETPVDTC
ncbi:MAG TPA: lanthionine synthetase LanC family protein, partial [Pseudonocardiaceae bacterium]